MGRPSFEKPSAVAPTPRLSRPTRTSPMTMEQAASLTAGTSFGYHPFFKHWLPYLFQRVEHPKRKHVFLPLARDYQPLGYLGGLHANYDDAAVSNGVVFSRDPASFKKIWWHSDSKGRFWLYDDSATSRFDYFARLERLLLKSNTLLAMEKAR